MHLFAAVNLVIQSNPILPDLLLVFSEERGRFCFANQLIQFHLDPIILKGTISLLTFALVDRLIALGPRIPDIVRPTYAARSGA
jgi:hypothetical protein